MKSGLWPEVAYSMIGRDDDKAGSDVPLCSESRSWRV